MCVCVYEWVLVSMCELFVYWKDSSKCAMYVKIEIALNVSKNSMSTYCHMLCGGALRKKLISAVWYIGSIVLLMLHRNVYQ